MTVPSPRPGPPADTGPSDPAPSAAHRPVRTLRPDVDLHVAAGPAGLTAAMARAAARGLRELGAVARAGPEADWLDEHVAVLRAADTLAGVRVSVGLRVALLDPSGRTDLADPVRRRLSMVDRVLLVPDAGRGWHRRGARPETERLAEDVVLAALKAVAGLPVPVTLADPFAVLAAHRLTERDLSEDAIGAIGWACAQAGVAIEVTERWRTPSVRSAVLLARAGAPLVAGSGARTAAEVGRWDHVSTVAAAVAAPESHPDGTRPRTRRPAESSL